MHPLDLQLDDVALLLRVAELGSLSAAARERNIPVSQVSRCLRRLETMAGVRLLHRSTHGLRLTDEGDTFLDYGRRLLDLGDALAGELGSRTGGPSGWVRLSVSPVLAQTLIAPSLCALYDLYPRLHLDISADDRMADLARDGIDLAIRTGTPHSDTLVATPIGRYSRSLYAAPSYLARWGMPTHPDDLARHRLITNSTNPQLARWPLSDPDLPDAAPGALLAQGHTRTDNSAVVMALAQNGVGIARLMDLLAQPLVASGALVRLLPQHITSPEVPIYAVMPQQRQRLPKVRACIDFWRDWMGRMGAPATPGTTP